VLEARLVRRDEFAHHVKDALANFYDAIHLQSHPLARLLGVQPAPGQTAGECLREILRGAIESFRPPASIPFGRPEWLGYRLLWLRYVQSLEQVAVSRELGLSQASYYRRHQEAMGAIASALWAKYQETSSAQAAESKLSAGGAAGEAARLACHSARQLVDLRQLVAGIVETVLPLAQQRGADLQTDIPSAIPAAYVDPGMLRQAILSAVVEGIELTGAGPLLLTAREREQQIVCRLQGLSPARVAARGPAGSTGLAVARAVLRAYGGRLWMEENAELGSLLCFALPVARPACILIVDDDPGTIELYQRNLPPGEYLVRTARSREEMQAQLAQSRPDLILLDVLMPQADGWSILQRLKVMPETCDIPVVICSVLSQPGLALALGAAEVLNKPIDQKTLGETIRKLLPREGS
jgi:CheY-like chemotaxis protein